MANILIADDAGLMRLVMKGILERGGHSVAGEAEDGLQTAEQYRKLLEEGKAPDLVLMDNMMPNMDGIEAMKEILKIDPSAKVAMCSNISTGDAISRAVQAGARYFVGKPFSEEALLNAVRRALETERTSAKRPEPQTEASPKRKVRT